MATLFAIIYPSKDLATNAFDQAKALESAGYMKIMEQALISKDSSGEIKIGDENHPVLKGAGIGAAIGVLTGAIFLIPVAGLALGVVAGSLLGRWGKSGAEDDFKGFQQNVAHELQPGGSAILLLIQTDAPDRVVNDLGHFGGKLMSYDLSKEQLDELQKEIDKLSSQS